MKFIKLSIPLCLCLFVFLNQNKAQDIGTTIERMISRDSLNKTVETLYSNKNVKGLLEQYADSFTYMPEYKPAIISKKSLNDFYTQWFASATITSFEKRIYKLEDFPPYELETGNFSMKYTTKEGANKVYAGNYMVMRKHQPDDRLLVIAEAFGSGSWLEAKDVPYNNVQVSDPYILEQNQVSHKLMREITAFDKNLVKSIEEGNGKARAEGFTKDGIYMPHFGSILEGTDALLPYMLKTYIPEAKLYVKNTYREIFTSGNYIFLTGHFKGGWGDRTTGGKFEGNMFNLMKREADGKLYMYRQIANNDGD